MFDEILFVLPVFCWLSCVILTVALSNHSRSNGDLKLVPTTFNYNATRHDSTENTTFEPMFAHRPRFMIDLASPPTSSHNVPYYHHTMQQFIEHVKVAARKNNLKQQYLAKQCYDPHQSDPQHLIDQLELVRNRDPTMNRFSSKFIERYIITEKLNDQTYLIQHDNTDHRAQVIVQDIRPIN